MLYEIHIIFCSTQNYSISLTIENKSLSKVKVSQDKQFHNAIKSNNLKKPKKTQKTNLECVK